MPRLDSPKVGRRLLLAASHNGNGEHQNQNNTTLESCFMHDHVESLQEHFHFDLSKSDALFTHGVEIIMSNQTTH